MRHIKASVALILLIVFTSLNASCGALKEPTETTSGTISKETVNSEYKKLDVEDFYIAVGYSQPFEMTRLMHFEGQRTEYVWWIQDKDIYCFGGIYVLNEKLKPQIEARKYKEGPWEKDVFGSYVELDMIGNCKDLMTLKTLEVTYAELDDLEGKLLLKDTEPVFEGESGEYTYTYATYDTFDAKPQMAKPGDIYVFVFPYKNIMIPLEKVEG